MSYTELTAYLAANALPEQEYYRLLLDNAKVILDQLNRTKKGVVATELGMTSQTFSLALKFLKAML